MTANLAPATKADLPTLLTIDQTAEHLQVSSKTVRRWIKNGELVAYRIGRQLRISDADLSAFICPRRHAL